MNSSFILSNEDCPKRQSLYMRGIEREALSFHQLLVRGVEYGVQSEADDPGKAASDEVMRLCLSRPIETEEGDLIGLAEHVSSLAEMVTWVLRTGPAWVHPKPIQVGDETWTPSSWAIPGGLRRIVFCDRWSDQRALQEVRAWPTLEAALYGLPMTIVAVVLGAMREGRRHGPLTKGWLHPRSQELRFRKRDGTGFDGNWEPVFRENSDLSREEWLEAMTADDVMADTFVIHPAVEWPQEEALQIVAQARTSLARLRDNDGTEHARALSRCFDSIHPCEFRFPCAYFKEPEIGKGFIPVQTLR